MKKNNISCSYEYKLLQQLNITLDGVKYNLKKLKDNGIIERIGADHGGYWQVNE